MKSLDLIPGKLYRFQHGIFRISSFVAIFIRHENSLKPEICTLLYEKEKFNDFDLSEYNIEEIK